MEDPRERANLSLEGSDVHRPQHQCFPPLLQLPFPTEPTVHKTSVIGAPMWSNVRVSISVSSINQYTLDFIETTGPVQPPVNRAVPYYRKAPR